MASAQNQAKKRRARNAAEMAMSGDLPRVGEYPVSENGSYRSVLPPVFFTNTDVSAGDYGSMYMDLQNKCIIIAYGDE